MIPKSGLQLFYSRTFLLRSEMERMLTSSMAFSCLLVICRVAYTGRITFLFLTWNLFLAFIPWFISQQLMRKPQWIENKFLFAFFFLIWLAFVPNAFYILTDLYHLQDHYNDRLVPNWYDLSMILSFAWNGLLLGIISVRQMEKMVSLQFLKKHELLFLYPVMWLNALGIYTGRYLRYNSWDMLTDPFHLIRSIAAILIHPVEYRYASGMIFCFSILLTLIYLSVKKISKTIW